MWVKLADGTVIVDKKLFAPELCIGEKEARGYAASG